MRRTGLVLSSLFILTTAACSSDKQSTNQVPTSAPAPAARSIVVRGNATLDGKPFDSKFVGAVVMKDGLVTPCQQTLPPVKNGAYEIPVYAASESSGCGAPGARIALWTSANDAIIFSREAVEWPSGDGPAEFAAEFSTASPQGATPETTQFQGGVYSAENHPYPAGTRVDAFISGTRCGTASVRTSPDFTGFILSVVGPDAIAGCVRGAKIDFTANDRPTVPTAVNTPPGPRETFNLRVP